MGEGGVAGWLNTFSHEHTYTFIILAACEISGPDAI